MDGKTKAELLEENKRLHRKISDYEILLEATVGHSDGLEADLLREVDDAIKESEKKFRSITETLPVPILITLKSDGTIIYANEPAGDFFGLPTALLLNRNITTFHDPGEGQRVSRLLAEQGHLKHEELKGHDAAGTPWCVELTTTPMEFNGRPCLLSIYHDITRRRMLEQQLRQAQKMEAVGTLAGGIAHDFNNILLIISGYAQLSLGCVEEDTRVHGNLEAILVASDRAKNLVRQILDFSRRSEQSFKPIQVGTIVEESLKLLRASLPATVGIKEEISSRSPIMGDPTQIHQILMNLCTNAGYAMRREGGVLTVALTDLVLDDKFAFLHPEIKPGPYLKLSVSDTGRGMTPETRQRVFEPFFSTKDKSRGSGLGLSVVHGIVTNHGGTVTVQSTPGEGAVFNVFLPVTQKHRLPSPVTTTATPEGSEHILMVDDEEAIVEVGRSMFSSLGYEVTSASGSLEALNLFKQDPHKFDLVVTDLTMPEMTGEKLAVEMMKIRSDIPVILCTGNDETVLKKRIMETGVKAVIMKPFTIDQISRLLRKALDG